MPMAGYHGFLPGRASVLLVALVGAICLAGCVNERKIDAPGDDPSAATRAPNITAVAAPEAQGLPPDGCGSPTEPWGLVSGGTEILVTGSNFQSESQFYVGSQRAPVVGSVQDNQARITTPPGRTGLVDVVVVNPNGNIGRKTSAFIYCPQPAQVCLNFLTPAGCPIPGDDATIFCPVDSTTAASCPVAAGDLAPKVEIGDLLPLRVRVKNLSGGEDLRGVEFCAAPPCDLDDTDDTDIGVTSTDGASIALFAGPTPTSRDLLVGETGVFRYDFSALSAGTIQFGVRVSGYNDREGSIVLFPASGMAPHPATFRLTPLQVTMGVNSDRVSAGEQIRVTVSVGNAGNRDLLQVAPLSPNCNGDADATLRYSSVPPVAEELPELEPFTITEFVFIYEARCEGSISFSTLAAALDSAAGNPVVEGVERTSPLVTVEGSLPSCATEPARIDCPRN